MNDQPEVEVMPFQMNPFITIIEKEDRVQVHLRGSFPTSDMCSKELTELYNLSNKYPTVEVFINSPGGAVCLLTEMLAILNNFDVVVTIAAGTVASAAFMLWSVADIRVIQPYAWMMAHRESWSLGRNKTDAYVDAANYNSRLYSAMLIDCCSETLTDEELEKAKHTEVYIHPDDLIDSGIAMEWEEYLIRSQLRERHDVIIETAGRKFISEGENVREVLNELELGDPFPYHMLPFSFPLSELLGEEEEREQEIANEDDTDNQEIEMKEEDKHHD